VRRAAAFTLLLLAAAGLTVTARARAAALRATWPPEADLMYLPTSATLRRLALGHTELAADLVAARANVYYGTQATTKGGARWLGQYLHTAIDLDPRFGRLYLSGAAMVVYHGGAITADNVLEADTLLERGVRAFPGDWNLHFQLGFNRFWELPEAAGEDDPRVAGWRQQGLESLRRATLFEGVPAWMPNLVARLLTKRGADELAIRHLEEAYAATSSRETREQIRLKLQDLQRQSIVEQIEEGRRKLEAEVARGYPYAPEAFSVILGPRRGRAIALPGADAAPPPAGDTTEKSRDDSSEDSSKNPTPPR
jgi:hypothetical protein